MVGVFVSTKTQSYRFILLERGGEGTGKRTEGGRERMRGDLGGE